MCAGREVPPSEHEAPKQPERKKPAMYVEAFFSEVVVPAAAAVQWSSPPLAWSRLAGGSSAHPGELTWTTVRVQIAAATTHALLCAIAGYP